MFPLFTVCQVYFDYCTTGRFGAADTAVQRFCSCCLFHRVDELKERLEQVEQENRQAQETISFKDNELEVL